MFSAAEIIDFAVQIEQNGEKLCREVSCKKIDPDLTSLLEWMAEQEAQHIQWFSDFRLKIRITDNFPQLKQFGETLLGDILGDQSFSLHDADFTKKQTIKDLLSLLIEFEQDTVLFYEMLSTAIEDKETLSFLDKIIAEENQHMVQIKDYFSKRFGPINTRNGAAAKPAPHS